MSELSPAAQAVFWAFNSKFDWIEDGIPDDQFKAIGAALRAAVDQVLPEVINAVGDEHDDARRDQWIRIRCKFSPSLTSLKPSSHLHLYV